MGLAPCETLLQISIPNKNFAFFVFFVEKNRTLISDLTQSNFKVLLITIESNLVQDLVLG